MVVLDGERLSPPGVVGAYAASTRALLVVITGLDGVRTS
jgi:hypothetical protein